MARYSKKQTQVSVETQHDALKMAKATQKPGQTKEQTKLIAQGVQKGIDLYKKQQKEKSRELNKKLKRVSGKLNQLDTAEEGEVEVDVIVQQSRLAWVLLLVSWVGFVGYILNI